MPGAHDHPTGLIPFWIHQLVELLLGILLLVEGARTGEHTAVLVALGALLLLLALCSEGALGAWPWIGRRLHRVLDLVVAVVLAISPVVLGLDRVLAIVILEAAAVGMVWLALRTQWRAPAARRRAPRSDPSPRATRSPSEPPPGAPSPTVTPPPSAPAPPPRPATPPVPAARKLGSAVGKARDDGPRQLGRLVGRAHRAAKAAMAPDDASRPDSRPEPRIERPDPGDDRPSGP